jgi:trehalose 6-phosphate synthase/phosphatase
MTKMGREGRIIVVSNRLPVTASRRGKEIRLQSSPGGVATAFRSLAKEGRVIFVGWPGIYTDKEVERRNLTDRLLDQHHSVPVFLTNREINQYYLGFSNKTIWPLFHYFTSYCRFDRSEWESYRCVNEKFFNQIAAILQQDDTVWIHDYHLMLLPELVRRKFPVSRIGFFLHIPFPSSELFRILPWRTEILDGLLGSDLIGFHTFEYARHFLSSVLRLKGYDHDLGSILVHNRMVRVGNFPIGIDIGAYERLAKKASIKKRTAELKMKLRKDERKIVLSVDRLDYTKGIPERLEAFECFLSQHREWHGKIIYLMLCVPSRTKVDDYLSLKTEVDALVGRINGRFGFQDWIPIHYMYRSLSQEHLLSFYQVADVALVTPIRDGMNLVAKEFIAAREDRSGVLILSETAGAAGELSEALSINVNNREEVVGALSAALEMDEEKQIAHMKSMRKRLAAYDIHRWAEDFLDTMQMVKDIQMKHEEKKLERSVADQIVKDYRNNQHRLIFLDYDGTLVPFAPTPELAKPDKEVLEILDILARHPGNRLVVISGRDQATLNRWLGNIPCGLVAEHGAWIRPSLEQDWEMHRQQDEYWKEELRSILDKYTLSVPGSITEEKDHGLAWHYRRAVPELAQIRSRELFDYLSEFLANTELQLLRGHKVIEIRPLGINKGNAGERFLQEDNWDFILAIGDDWTDEDLFRVLPPSAHTIKVGLGESKANFYLESQTACRHFLAELASS